MIFPDFSSQDIETALNAILKNNRDLLVFSSTTRTLLETLGIDLKNIFLSEGIVREEQVEIKEKETQIQIEKIKREDVDQLLLSSEYVE